MRPDRATVAAFIAIVIFGGLNAIAVKASFGELAPFWSAGSRFMVAGLLLAGLVLLTGRHFPTGRSLGGGLLYGLVSFAGAFGLIYPALQDVPAGTVILFLALVPLETFGLVVLHGQERFHLQGLLGALVAVGGVAVVVGDQLSADVPIGSMLLVLAGTLFIAEGAVILKWVPRSDPFATNAVAMLGGGIVLLAISRVIGDAWIVPTQAATWLAMAYLVLLGSIAMFGLFVFAVQRWTASAVSYVTLLMPLVTIPIAAILFGERITPQFLAGGALAVAGVYVGAFLRVRPGRPSATSTPECLPIDNCGPPPRRARAGAARSA